MIPDHRTNFIGMYFVMMNNLRGDKILPLLDDKGDVVLWKDLHQAQRDAEKHFYAKAFGYEVFERGTGE